MTALMTACGGGGGGGEEDEPALEAQAALSVPQGSLELSLHQSVVALDVAGGSGSGELSFSSSDTSVVTVDASGNVTPISAGVAAIDVKKAADNRYLAAATQVAVTVLLAPQVPLLFLESEKHVFIDAEPFSNPLTGGSGEGELHYTSSDPTVATVEEHNGVVTIVGEGSSEITARKQSDAEFTEATASYLVQVDKYSQQVMSFEQSLVEAIVNAPAPSNPLTGGSGLGAVTFSSSDSSVATVNSEGAISTIAAGTAEITAYKAGDENYRDALARYEVEVTELLSELSIGISYSNTAIQWSSPSDAIEMIRSSYYRCNADQYQLCSNGTLKRFYEAPQRPYRDNFLKIGTLGYLQFQNEDYRSNAVRVEAKTTPLASKRGHQLVAFKNKLWLFGGVDVRTYYVRHNEYIWSSSDGADWAVESGDADYGKIHDHTVVVFKDQLYLFGGERAFEGGAGRFSSEVWRSSNGTDWDLISNDSPAGHRGDVIVFNGKLWAITSNIWNDNLPAEVWSSEDGENWTKEVAIAPFGSREGFALYANDDKLFLAGGYVYSGSDYYLQDVWGTTDGIEWNRETEHTGVGQLWDATVTNINGAFYMFLGHGISARFNRPYYRSEDGIRWSIANRSTMSDNGPPSIAQLKGQTFLLGANGDFLWQTSDGEQWRVPVGVSNLRWTPR
ncbi:hypothetical protein [uncultured Gilvimarinus sp.]|uniref:hypothetical protein n=1 Tax=uncultured Gilvimarinus sp. TaxID=1689143 RepID=UPI0030EDA8CF